MHFPLASVLRVPIYPSRSISDVASSGKTSMFLSPSPQISYSCNHIAHTLTIVYSSISATLTAQEFCLLLIYLQANKVPVHIKDDQKYQIINKLINEPL